MGFKAVWNAGNRPEAIDTGDCAIFSRVALDWLMRRLGWELVKLTSLQLPTVQSDGHKMSLLQEMRVLGFSRCWQSLDGRACSSEPMVWTHSTVRFFSPWGPHVAEHASHSPAHHLQTHTDMREKIIKSMRIHPATGKRNHVQKHRLQSWVVLSDTPAC